MCKMVSYNSYILLCSKHTHCDYGTLELKSHKISFFASFHPLIVHYEARLGALCYCCFPSSLQEAFGRPTRSKKPSGHHLDAETSSGRPSSSCPQACGKACSSIAKPRFRKTALGRPLARMRQLDKRFRHTSCHVGEA